MPHPWFEIWLIHPDPDACAAFERRFAGLPDVRVLGQRYEQLPAHDCFVTAGNSYGLMTAGIDAAVIARFGHQLMREVQEHIMERHLGEQPIGSAFILATGDHERPYLCPAMGTGFGQLDFDEAARQMAVAYAHYLRPPGHPTWDALIARERRICHDGGAQSPARSKTPS